MKRVLITGANRGIGLGLALACAARGDHIFATCRTPVENEELHSLAAQYPGRITILPLDVTDETGIADCATRVASLAAGLDILFNNAAVNFGDESLSNVRSDVLLNTLQINAIGPLLVAQQFLDLLHHGEDPKIVNISSESGSISTMVKFRGYGYYGSKAALNMYTRALAVDPQAEGITVIAMHPGWVRTDMGGSGAHLSIQESAAGILRVCDGLRPEDNNKFYTWEGKLFPW
ncbi:MAG: SDR family oxidoreductase [Anaerolineales bacterium]|nr:SDR family oxidoreductase [Anaerolineales bacterium]